MRHIATGIVLLAVLGMMVGTAMADEASAPRNLEAIRDGTKVTLIWDEPSDEGDGIDGYYIGWKSSKVSEDDDDDYNKLEDTENMETIKKDITVSRNGDLAYKVCAISRGTTSTACDKVDVEDGRFVKPDKPRDLVADDVADDEVKLSWKAPSDDGNDVPLVRKYIIEYKKDSDSWNGDDVTSQTSSKLTRTISGLTTDEEYTFRVLARNFVGDSDPSEEKEAKPTDDSKPDASTDKPGKPKDVEAVPVSATQIVVTWKAPSDDGSEITGYDVEVKIDSGSWKLISENQPTKSFEHNDLEKGTNHYYRISARNSAGQGSASEQVNAIPESSTKPTNLVATKTSSNDVRLEWIAPSDTSGQGIGGYIILEEISNGVYDESRAQETSGDETHFILKGLDSGKTYKFVVQAKIGPYGKSNPSDRVTVKVSDLEQDIPDDPPSKPINLRATASSPIQIDIEWDEPIREGDGPVTGYKIQVKMGDGNFTTLVKDTKSTNKLYQHTDVKPDIEHTYMVSAINLAGTGLPSNNASAITITIPPEKTIPSEPQSFSAKATSKSQINLSWRAPDDKGNADKITYKLEVKSDGQFDTITADAGRDYSHTGLQPNTTYTFRIYAVNEIGSSEPAETSATTEAEKIIDLTVCDPGYTNFPDPTINPQTYLDRYENEEEFKEWFDSICPDRDIKVIVGEPWLPEEPEEPVIDPKDLSRLDYYTMRYENEPSYKVWFDKYFDGKGLDQVVSEAPNSGTCGKGTELKDGICQIII